eukprot:10435-Hanusia_phi.AAC.4
MRRTGTAESLCLGAHDLVDWGGWVKGKVGVAGAWGVVLFSIRWWVVEESFPRSRVRYRVGVTTHLMDQEERGWVSSQS